MSSEKERKEHPEETELRRLRILLKILAQNLEHEDRCGVVAMRLEPIDLKGKLHIEHSFELEVLLDLGVKLVDNKLTSLRAGKARSQHAKDAREKNV